MNGVRVDPRDNPFPLERVAGGAEEEEAEGGAEEEEDEGGDEEEEEGGAGEGDGGGAREAVMAQQIAELEARLAAAQLLNREQQQQHEADVLQLQQQPGQVPARDPRGRRKLPWDQLGTEQKRVELRPVTDQLDRLAEGRGTDVEKLAASIAYR